VPLAGEELGAVESNGFDADEDPALRLVLGGVLALAARVRRRSRSLRLALSLGMEGMEVVISGLDRWNVYGVFRGGLTVFIVEMAKKCVLAVSSGRKFFRIVCSD